MSNKYFEYFEIDEDYFPQVNDSTIQEKPDCWKRTFPHQTFIEMLKNMERCLARQEKRSLWIEGAYGTGKSQCAYTLKKLLEVPEDDFRKYWSGFKPLENQKDLMEKLLGHKRNGIVTAYKYASGGINSPRDLFLAIQEEVKNALVTNNLYTGENTLKESVIAWIEEPSHKKIFDILLEKPEWKATFTQSSADDVLDALRKNSEVKQLMENVFRLADKEGITALNIDADRLIAWISDVIDKNNVKIVFIWDEFSDYFKNNRESLSEFQKIAELVNAKPFFFVVVTHESGQLFTTSDTTWTKVRDRFVSSQISLPDNIAFELIGHALNVKNAAKDSWGELADDLNGRVSSSRSAVMKVTKISEPHVMKDIMPLHPMAALLLKNIAAAFKSNQRSMFDFIKSSNIDDVKAFQWFIQNTGPYDDHPLLTVDMLWNFFYEKGRNYLSSDIRVILDTFQHQQDLRDDEKTVLKAVLIMQAIDQRLGGTIDLFKATEQNISYVFEGIDSGLDGACKNIAKQLVSKGVLVSTPISGGRYVYSAAVLAGDQVKIDDYKKDIRKGTNTAKLVTEGGLASVLSLNAALKLRYEIETGSGKITPVTMADFSRTINMLRDKTSNWKFHAVIAFAKDDSEATSFRKQIKDVISDKQYEKIVFIDALSTPLGLESFEQYVDYSAMAMYYNGNNNSESKENTEKAKRILDQDWKNRIYNGQFIVYTYSNQEGEKFGNAQGVASTLQSIVTKRFPFTFDFTKGLTENQLKLTQAQKSAKSGITEEINGGILSGIEKNILPNVWRTEKYWDVQPALPISKIKIEIDNLINTAFNRDGQVSIGDIYDFLESKYGLAPCNLSAFLTGFLLKEYSSEPFRYSDSTGSHETMTYDKLAEMIGNYVGKTPKPTYIVKMTPEEMAFYELTEKAWKIPPSTCSSTVQAGRMISARMKAFQLPVWCLSEVDENGIFNVLQKYIEFVQKEGNEAHRLAIEIGKYSLDNKNLAEQLSLLITSENCQKGMKSFLTSFESGRILSLAKEIMIDENVVLADIRKLFDVKHSCLWDQKTGEDEIRKLTIDYNIVKETNIILNSSAHSLLEAYKEWRNKLSFIGISNEILKSKFTSFSNIFDSLLKICQQTELLPEQRRSFCTDIKSHGAEIRDLFNNDKKIFAEAYSPYLENLSENDISDIKSKLTTRMYELPKTDCNTKVKSAAEEFRKGQLKTKLHNLWKNKTGTKDPYDWSYRYKTPILCMVDEDEFGYAKKAFETIRRISPSDTEIKVSLEFLESTNLFETLSDEKARNELFKSKIIGEFSSLLPCDRVLDALDRMSIEPYDWYLNPSVKNMIRKLAEAEYNAGGSDKALNKIDSMPDAQLKQYLKRLVKDNMTVGIEIITSEG